MQNNTKTTGFAAGEVSSVAAELPVPLKLTMMSPRSLVREHFKSQQTKIAAAREQLRNISNLLQEHKSSLGRPRPLVASSSSSGHSAPAQQTQACQTQAPREQMRSGVSAPRIKTRRLTKCPNSPSNDGMPGQTLDKTEADAAGSLVVLPNGRTARIERVETTTRVINGTLSPGGTVVRKVGPQASGGDFVYLKHTWIAGSSDDGRPLSPTSRPGARVVLPNGRTATITRVELPKMTQQQLGVLRWWDVQQLVYGLSGSQVYYYENGKWNPSAQPMSRFQKWPVASNQQVLDAGLAPRVENSTIRPAQHALSPTSRLGAEVMLPNGKIATVSRVEVGAPMEVLTENSATPRPGEVVVLPNGRTATVLKIEVSKFRKSPRSSRANYKSSRSGVSTTAAAPLHPVLAIGQTSPCSPRY